MMDEHLTIPSLMDRTHYLLNICDNNLIISYLKISIILTIHGSHWESSILIWMGPASSFGI